MTEHVSRRLGKCLKMGSHICEQDLEIAALMIMRNRPSGDPPEPLNTVRIGIIGWRIDQVQVLFQFSEHAAHQQRTCFRVSPEIVGKHDGDPSATFGTSHGGTHLFAKHIGGPSRSNSTIEPAIAPVHQAKTVDFAGITWCLDQALHSSAFTRPDTGKGRMKGKLDLILQIEVSSRQQGQQIGKVSGKLIPQINLDKIFDG